MSEYSHRKSTNFVAEPGEEISSLNAFHRHCEWNCSVWSCWLQIQLFSNAARLLTFFSIGTVSYLKSDWWRTHKKRSPRRIEELPSIRWPLAMGGYKNRNNFAIVITYKLSIHLSWWKCQQRNYSYLSTKEWFVNVASWWGILKNESYHFVMSPALWMWRMIDD